MQGVRVHRGRSDGSSRMSLNGEVKSLIRKFVAGVIAACLLLSCAEEPREAVTEAPLPAGASPAPEVGTVELPEIDVASGLVIDEHWELVKAHCSACHSSQLVTQNRGSRQNWLEMIRWMQETQGLWQFDEATETSILDYLEKNYAPSSIHRRAPLPKALIPDNPYPGDTN